MHWRRFCALVILGVLTTLTTACERKAAQITGTVTSSETGFPLSGVAIRLGKAQITTDSSGKYAVSIELPGSQKLYAWLSGYEPYSTEITVGSSSVEWSFALLRQPATVTEAPTESEARPGGQQTGTSAVGTPSAQSTVPGVSLVEQGTAGTQVPTGMVLVPAGSFRMGDSLGGGVPNERPVHSVYVSAFYMEPYEVTKALWDEVARWAAAHGYDIVPGNGSGAGPAHPVTNVSWFQTVKWANARSEKEGLAPSYTLNGSVYRTGQGVIDCNWSVSGYRLPTEAEWEKAARGGAVGRRYPWNETDAIDKSKANYGDYYHGTTPVGSFAPNGYGLFDMAGNVQEWCWDSYDAAAYDPDYVPQPGSDPRGPAQKATRVARGGNCYDPEYLCTVSYRTPRFINEYGILGFRLVRMLR